MNRNRIIDNIYSLEPKLLNEKKLKYEIKSENEPKMPINEMILQLAIDTANECPNESVEEIIRQNFDRNLNEMFKKTEERTPKQEDSLYDVTNDKHFIFVRSKFDDLDLWVCIQINLILFFNYVKFSILMLHSLYF
jgi:hypothetical protein